MSDLGNIVSAGQEVLELHVHDVEEALAYYGAEVGSEMVDHLGRVAYLVADGALVILRELKAH